jgi:alpha-amylase
LDSLSWILYNSMRSSVALVLAGLAGWSSAATPDQWAQRSIYQVITDRFARSADQNAACNITQYCGGTWAGLVDQLDYIQNMGFTAVQISPIQENLPQDTIYGQAFHGYWPQNLYELNAKFGTEDDFKNLVSELHKRDMYVLVDVVANELAYDIGDANMTSTTKIDYSTFVPFNSSSDFVSYCPIDNWNNQTEFQSCWLGFEGVATPRIKTTDPGIANTLNQWIKSLVGTYDIDGIRVDGAKQIEAGFFSGFMSSAGVYGMGEVDDGDPVFTCSYQNLTGGIENYPVWGALIPAFSAGKMDGLVSMVGAMRQACPKPQYLATFVENQDNTRFASYTEDLSVSISFRLFVVNLRFSRTFASSVASTDMTDSPSSSPRTPWPSLSSPTESPKSTTARSSTCRATTRHTTVSRSGRTTTHRRLYTR